VNDHLCDEIDRVNLLAEVLHVQTELERGWGFWVGRAERTKGPYRLQFREFGSLTKAIDEVLLIGNKINHCKEALATLGNFTIPVWHNETRLQTLIQTCIHSLLKIHKAKIKNEIRGIESSITALSTKANVHPVCNLLLKAIRLRKQEAYVRSYAKIVQLGKLKQAALWIDKALEQIGKTAPHFAGNIGANAANDCWNERVKQMPAAWRWALARTWLQDYIRKEDAPSLEKRVRQIEDEIGKAIAQIASLRAWSFCFSRMKEEHRRHMEAWQQSMVKLGKGTGKHAPKHRRDAQKHLNECRAAVPAWVMPIHRVWDTIDPAPGMFDMIVVDEASQCGFEALPLFYLGKKILIVGDDKQISPDAVGIPRDAVHRLMKEYLYDFQFKSSFDVENSLFDHGKLRYGTRRITLREHFRCMPEIIRFSNDLCYSDAPLIPLRQYGPDRLLPIRRVHLSDGYREGSHSRVINRSEAEAIVDKIVELCHEDQYENKTIGVIVLQGDAQAGLIENLLLSRLGADEMEKRRLICGNAYSFQGDERDIMFLSMVAATNAKIGPLTMRADERRFNVAASRARDQMWLFHSVTLDDLSSSCLRRRLLQFFDKSTTQPVSGVDFEELEKSVHQANRSIVAPPDPFDSWFEVDVALEIARKGFHVIPQFEVAGKFIDLVVEGGQARMAVECDGDAFHGAEQYEDDMLRQRVLERCGWVFFRVRSSSFYANKESSLEGLWRMLEERGIQPQGDDSSTQEEEKSGKKRSETNFGEEFGESDKEPSSKVERVEVDDTVVYIIDENSDSERQVMITSGSSNPEWGTINFRTPIAQALLGASTGDKVLVKLPTGSAQLCIKEIKKGSP